MSGYNKQTVFADDDPVVDFSCARRATADTQPIRYQDEGGAWRAAREHKRLTIEQLARLLGGLYLMPRLYDIERGASRPTSAEQRRLEQVLGATR